MRPATTTRTRVRRIVAAVVGVGLVVAGVGVTALTQQEARAAQAASVLSGFDPANIIDDAVMFNSGTMSASDIQSFLNRMQPSCASGATCLKSVSANMPKMTANPMCRSLAAKSNATTAQIIAAVASACNVNPEVMLVMLQKEQTLITGRKPYSGETVSLIYRKATGLGCPDTAACDPAKYGLFNQLYGVAYWLVRYTMPAGTGPGTQYSSVYNWFPVGRPNGVLYNPSVTCGARTITIRNKATASLYYYTPYQPNAASLSAGWGLGDTCSSYGNRNFYLYFTTWFGSTHTVVTGAIKTFWTANKNAYGNPTANAVTSSANGGGTSQTFQKGTIYTSPSGSYGVSGSMLAKYTALGGPAGKLGWPRKAAFTRTGPNGGAVQGFQKGTVYISSAGTAAVLAPVYSTFVGNGYELGRLGWPTADAVVSTNKGGATWQSFQGGRVVVAGSTATTVTGATLEIWLRRGADANILGWPAGPIASVTASGSTGTVQPFQQGVVVVHGKSYTVSGVAGTNYVSHGGPTGVLGWPTGVATSSTANGGGWSQRFAGGAIFWTTRYGARALAGRILGVYDRAGGVAGVLGWPTSSTHDSHGIGGGLTIFTGGRVYSSKVGAFAVRGDILAKYLQQGGTGGSLGWPTSNATTVKGALVQTFQHGRISWTQAGGARASRS